MWFRNLVVHRLPDDWSFSAAALEERLSQYTLMPCSPLQMLSRGWVPVPGSDGRLVHTTEQQHLIALGVDQKLLPGTIIRQIAAERAVAQEKEQGFPVGRRQMRDIKMQVTDELRARALTRRRITRAWIDARNQWFIVDAASAARAEELVETLRDTLGSFAAQFVETRRSPHQSMMTWLKAGDAPPRFSIDDDLELRAGDKSKGTIRYSHHPLDGKEIQAHLSAGKFPTRLGLTWNGRIAFVLTENLQIKRVEFIDIKKDVADGSEVGEAEQFDIDFALMTGELAKLLDDLTQAMGGEVQDQAAAA
jgi:recombination associated protein RdgC